MPSNRIGGNGRVDRGELRVGIMGTDNTHAYPFTAFLNGWTADVPVPTRLPNGRPVPGFALWARLLRRLATGPGAQLPIANARVTSVWSDDPAEAALLARACDVERTCATPAEACEDVDAVLVLSEDPRQHLAQARHALEGGLPTFVDKPVAEDLATAAALFSLADRFGAPCFTASSLRWAPELLAVRDELAAASEHVLTVDVAIPGAIELYGIHGVEVINLFLGHDVATVSAADAGHRQVVILGFRDGRSGLLQQLGFLTQPIYATTLYGESWSRRICLEPPLSHLGLVRHIVEFARTGRAPVGATESIRLLRLALAAREALETGTTITIPSQDEE